MVKRSSNDVIRETGLWAALASSKCSGGIFPLPAQLLATLIHTDHKHLRKPASNSLLPDTRLARHVVAR